MRDAAEWTTLAALPRPGKPVPYRFSNSFLPEGARRLGPVYVRLSRLLYSLQGRRYRDDPQTHPIYDYDAVVRPDRHSSPARFVVSVPLEHSLFRHSLSL